MDGQKLDDDKIKDTDQKSEVTESSSYCDASCEKGRHDAASIADQHAREIPPLESQQIDKGDSVINPMADKREGIKREEAES